MTLIVVGIVLLSLGVVVAALMTLPARARLLRRAMRRLSWRAEEAQRLQAKALVVQENAAALQARLAETQARAETLQAMRAMDVDGPPGTVSADRT
jgi:Zn-dependent membrane protease YugP